MGTEPETDLDQLWKEYRSVFEEFDDLSLARWLAQTLGQFAGRCWRTSHPLAGAYRLAAQAAHERQIWLKRLVTAPPAYVEAPCCRAPLLPLLTRDVPQSGLLCPHCDSTLVPLEDLPAELQTRLCKWGNQYAEVHAVAHWDERQQRGCGDYDAKLDDAAGHAATLLGEAGSRFGPELLELYPAVFWEDQDECLEVRPEDIVLG